MPRLSSAPRPAATTLWYGVVALLLMGQILGLWLMGRIWICDCGTIKLFEGGVNTAGNSQHLSDWYTPSHILHGFLFYAGAALVLPNRSLALRLALAVALEVGWELLENSPMVIEHYRTATMAVGYTGDSILNSVMDSLWMALGFAFAARAPIWLTISLAVGFELLAAWVIRDGLVLNVLMLAWPIESIKAWQMAL